MSDAAPAKPTVFVSYSHRDEVWKDRLLPHLKALQQADRLEVWHDRRIDAGAIWYPEIEAAMNRARVALCLVSANYLASDFCVKEEIPYLLTRREAGSLVIMPILVSPCTWTIAPWISSAQMLPRDGKSLEADYPGQWNVVLKEVADRVLAIVDSNTYSTPPAMPSQYARPAEERIDTRRLPLTGAELFGRQRELAWLDEAWTEQRRHVVSLVAWGGAGKTTLVRKWTERMDSDNFRDADRVFAWSFYTRPGAQTTSADVFITAALAFFGDSDPLAGSPWNKGERLAALVRHERALLILDGLESLQSEVAGDRGKVKDPSLAVLLESLAQDSQGLCIITTRQRVRDLDDYAEAAIQIDLEQISPEAGRALLRIGGTHGTDGALEQATRDFGQQALAINLLRSYLRAHAHGDIAAAASIPDIEVSNEDGRQPRRIIAVFEKALAGTLEIEILRILGLFDRPFDSNALDALSAAPAIPNLTEGLGSASGTAVLRAISHLRHLGLLAPESADETTTIDAHPVVREHFGERLRADFTESWTLGNARLYEYFKSHSILYPETLNDMMPLYAAIVHGCRAGKHQESFDRIYVERVRQRDLHRSTKLLGAFGTDLEVIGHFFETRWTRPVPQLVERAQIDLVGLAGYYLLVLGRPLEAVNLMKLALQRGEAADHWKEAAEEARNLSGVYLTLGDIKAAIEMAEHGVTLASKSDDPFSQIVKLTTVGTAYHQAGRLREAEKAFAEAEALQKIQQPIYPLLYAYQGFQYCDLLLTLGRADDVRARALKFFDWRLEKDSLLAKGMEHLAMARACIALRRRGSPTLLHEAEDHVQKAVDWLRESGQQHWLAVGLLTRAAVRRFRDQLKGAKADLEECLRIAHRGSMRLHQADAHLEGVRIALKTGESGAATAHLQTAMTLVAETGYHRRDDDIRTLQSALSL